tara:strand:+ start:168 stop:725 length:558 start_codon:yes stop_codon:yes gene_type:complete
MSINKSFSTETSERYSRALFEVLLDAKELEKSENDIKNFLTLYNSNKDIRNFFKNPTKKLSEQKKAIDLITDKFSFSNNLKNFFLLLIEKRRIFFIKKITETFLKICSKKRGEVTASLISSKELSLNELKALSNDLSESTGSILKLDYKVDEKLIGGLKLQLGSFMIDTSIKNKLKKYEQSMIEI